MQINIIFIYMRPLYMLEINPLSFSPFANIFSQSEGCIFASFMVFFAVQKLLNLTRSYLFIFVFIFITLEGLIFHIVVIHKVKGSSAVNETDVFSGIPLPSPWFKKC